MAFLYDDEFDSIRYTGDHPQVGAASAYEHFVRHCSAEAAHHYRRPRRSPVVTVVVPNYNGAQYLSSTLESVRRQTLDDWECIVVDDRSTDASIEIIDAFCQRDERFRLLVHHANGGLSAARNSGVRAARGFFVCFLDNDDLLIAPSLENRLGAIRAVGSYRLAGSYSASMTIGPHQIEPPKPKRVEAMKVVDFITASGMCPFNANQPMFRTSVLRDLGGFDEELRQAEDWELWMRILRHGYYLVPTHWCDVTYRTRPDSMVRSQPLLHVQVAAALQALAHMPLPEQKIFSNAPFAYRKPWSEYKRQLDLASRVFEFCGMAVASGHDVEAAGRVCTKLLPDFLGAIAQHRPLDKHVAAGMKRGTAGVVANEGATRYAVQLVTQQVLETFHQAEGGGAGGEVVHLTSRNPGYGPTPEEHRGTDVVFLPHASHHVWASSVLLERLDAAGISHSCIDLSYVCGAEGLGREIDARGLRRVSFNEFVLGEFRPKMVVCVGEPDAATLRVVESAAAVGLCTVRLDCDIREYQDPRVNDAVDTDPVFDLAVVPGELDLRRPVREANHACVGGLLHVDDMVREQTGFPSIPFVLINGDFGNGVPAGTRRDWLGSAVAACERLGYAFVLSKRSAAVGGEDARDDRSFYDLLRECSVVVSHFGNGVVEALAVGKPVVYYRPDGEVGRRFRDPLGAFTIARSEEELDTALAATVRSPASFLSRSDRFLELHCGTSRASPGAATRRVGEKLVQLLESADTSPDEHRARLKYLLIHREKLALSDPANLASGPSAGTMRPTSMPSNDSRTAAAGSGRAVRTFRPFEVIKRLL